MKRQMHKTRIAALAALLTLGLASAPASAHNNSHIVAPLAAFIAFSAFAHHQHRHHRHYYHGHGHGHGHGHYKRHRRHSHSHGGYKRKHYRHW